MVTKLRDLPGATDASQSADDGSAALADQHLKGLLESAVELSNIVARVSDEEFRWQESRYDIDSRRGRELLFLMANNEWVRATSEIVDVSRSDSIETVIKIDIDLDQITHEAFRDRTGRFWLPVAVVPPQATMDAPAEPDQHRLEPDPFATVTDAAGDLMPMLPTADARHQMSAAMAEIIVNMAVARWPGKDQERPIATRDQRLLLSAAIYRLLRRGLARKRAADGAEWGPETGPDREAVRRAPTNSLAEVLPDSLASELRMGKARSELLKLLGAYNTLLDKRAKKRPGDDDDSRSDAPQFAPELARRALRVLRALAESMVIVVPVNRSTAPTVVTVRVPTRSLHSRNEWKLTQPSTWPVRPLGHLEIDVLLPTADADREVQINLPDGVSFAGTHGTDRADTNRPRLDIRVKRPQPFSELIGLLRHLTDQQLAEWPPFLRQCLADLARSKAAAANEMLRHYEASSEKDQAPADIRQESTKAVRASLDELSAKLTWPGGGSNDALTTLKDAREKLKQESAYLFRRTSADRVSPRTVVARADMIEDVSRRAIPNTAKIRVDVAVTDGEYFSIARFSGRMSLLLMAMVFILLAAWRLLRHTTGPSPEVLAIVLTLFSAIQAGQMERPDRSTLRGLLSAPGNWLIAASIIPALALAVVLAFPWGGWVPTIWAAACVGGQVLFQLAMSRSPVATTEWAGPEQRHMFFTDPPDYRHFEALRSNYWRSTTADALMIGRTAYAYVLWQRSPSPQLTPLLSWRNGSPVQGEAPNQVQGEAANVLALLRSGTVGQATTFVVFRREPSDGWTDHADHVAKLDLDPNRLAPMESIVSVVDVFVGVSRDKMLTMATHPLVKMLKAAAHRLIVLDAQLPVPIPVAGYEDRQWARLRVALRDADDIKRLIPFLNAVRQCALTARQEHGLVVAVRTVPTVAPRVISKTATAPDCRSKSGPLVRADELDVVNTSASRDENPGARTWRTLTICSDAWSNIESDIVQGLAQMRPPLQLAGLTYALLYGKAVVVILAHEPGALIQARTDIEAKLQRRCAHARLQVPVNEDLTRSELGSAGKYPLLRIHFRWQDRPGALLNVLKSLSATLRDTRPSIEPEDWSISYARTQVAVGRSALARLTVRIHDAKVAPWKPDQLEEIAQKVQTLATREAAGGNPADSGGGEDVPEDPVISLELIRAPS
jgi:hypothetical protein